MCIFTFSMGATGFALRFSTSCLEPPGRLARLRAPPWALPAAIAARSLGSALCAHACGNGCNACRSAGTLQILQRPYIKTPIRGSGRGFLWALQDLASGRARRARFLQPASSSLGASLRRALRFRLRRRLGSNPAAPLYRKSRPR